MVFCPKCGYERQPKDDEFVPKNECPKCGIVYEKYAEMQRELNESRGTVFTHDSKKSLSSGWNISIWLFLLVAFLVAFTRTRIPETGIIVRMSNDSATKQPSAVGRTVRPVQERQYTYIPASPPVQFSANQNVTIANDNGAKELSNTIARLSETSQQRLNDSHFYQNRLYTYQWESIKKEPIYPKIQSLLANYRRQHTYMSDDLFVCLDMAIDVWNLLATAGIRSRIMVGNVQTDITDGNTVVRYIGSINHAWVLAQVSPSKYIPLETTGGFIVDPSMRNFRLYNKGIIFENPKQCKDFNVSRIAMFDTCNETSPMADNFNRLFVGKPMTAESTEYMGRMKQKFDDCERLTQKVIAFLGVR